MIHFYLRYFQLIQASALPARDPFIGHRKALEQLRQEREDDMNTQNFILLLGFPYILLK